MLKWGAIKATGGAYPAIDQEKKPQQEPANKPSSSSCCCFSKSLSALRRCAPTYWSTPLLILSALLATAMYAEVAVNDTDILYIKYAFEPMTMSWYTLWGVIVIVVLPLATFCTGLLIYDETRDRLSQRYMYLLAGAYIAVLLVGNALGAVETRHRLAFEAEFAVKFNAYYCNSRTLRLCLEGPDEDLEALLGLDHGSVRNNTTATDSTFSGWRHCRLVIADSIARVHVVTNGEPGDKTIEAGRIYKFVNDCKSSREVDAWCGNSYLGSASLTDQEQRSIPSPFATNPDMFEKYTREWSTRMFYSTILLGSAAGCLVLAGASLPPRGASKWRLST